MKPAMRKISLITAILMILSSLSVFTLSVSATGYSGQCGENSTWMLDDDMTLTISGEGEMYRFPVPPWDGLDYTTVIINEGITSISYGAFGYSQELTTVYIPESMEHIDDFAFMKCPNFRDLYYASNDVNWNKIIFGTSPFHDIVKFHFADGDEPKGGKCGDDAYWSYDGFRTLTVSGTGDMYDYLDMRAPWYGLSFSILVIEDGITSVGACNFSYTQLEKVTLGEGIRSIEHSAFEGDRYLWKISLPSTLESIGDYAFYECSTLGSITIPESVTSIGSYAFRTCYSISNIYISKNVVELGKNPFGCRSIDIDDENPEFTVVDGVLFTKDMSTLISYPVGKFNDRYTIPDSVSVIAEDAFLNNEYLVSLTIPDTVKSIGECAFWCCRSLESVVIPGSVDTIKNGTFYCCAALSDLTILNGVEIIEFGAFYHCYDLKSVYLPSSIKEIGSGAFETASYKFGTPDFKDIYFNGPEFLWNRIKVCSDAFDSGDRFHFCSVAGDINGDGYVNAKDSNLLKRIITGALTPDKAQLMIADIDGDGSVTTKDSYFLKLLILG